ncbi:hypothetical protein BGZ54_010253 [Gamsiella multidivaricata]|nr:hypothetical protein BGZ54_010253 [Gamsiella multidivaricata]
MDPDDLSAQQWQNSFSANAEPEPQPQPSDCNDYWFIPTYADTKVLEERLETFAHDTGAHMTFNKKQERIELWGQTSCIQRAKSSLDQFAAFYQDLHETKQKMTKTRGWAKPDRELTAAEKRKKEREDRRRLESQRYLGRPTEECTYQHRLNWPKDLPAFRLLGGNLQLLDALRTECKSFIWMDQPEMVLYVYGNDYHSTFTAMTRIKNYILKRKRAPFDNVCHILEKPSKLVEMHMVNASPMPYLGVPLQHTVPAKQGAPHSQGASNASVFIRAKEVAAFENLHEFDLSMASIEKGGEVKDRAPPGAVPQKAGEVAAVRRNDAYINSLKYTESMTERNIERIRNALEDSLNQVQLLDGEIKMRIRIGQISLQEYPRGSVWEIKEMDASVIRDPRLKTEFSPFFTKSSESFSALVKKLTPPHLQDHIVPPDVIWSLGVLKRAEDTNIPINVQLDVTFREKTVSLWNALVQKTTPLDIRVISSERNKGDEPTLVFANTKDVQLRYIRREKKRVFVDDPWVIELVEEAFWTLQAPYMPYQAVTLSFPADQVLYSVSMYRDSWVNRFSENPHLSLGQVPTWDPEDFFKYDEAIDKTMDEVHRIRDKIETLFAEF